MNKTYLLMRVWGWTGCDNREEVDQIGVGSLGEAQAWMKRNGLPALSPVRDSEHYTVQTDRDTYYLLVPIGQLSDMAWSSGLDSSQCPWCGGHGCEHCSGSGGY